MAAAIAAAVAAVIILSRSMSRYIHRIRNRDKTPYLSTYPVNSPSSRSVPFRSIDWVVSVWWL